MIDKILFCTEKGACATFLLSILRAAIRLNPYEKGFMAEKDNKFDVSKIGDTVIRDADSDVKPEFSTEDLKNPHQHKKPDKMNNYSGASYWHKNDTTFDVSKMGDTVIRDADSDIPHEPSKEQSSEQAEDRNAGPRPAEHPLKYQEPSPKGKGLSSKHGRLPPEIDDSM